MILPNGRTKTPWSTKLARKASRLPIPSSSTTPIDPFTRTSLTPGILRQGAKPRDNAAEIAATCCSRGSISNRSSDALAAGLVGAIGPECVEHLVGRDGRGKAQRTAGQRLRKGNDVGCDTGRFAGEQRAGAAEAGENLVKDQQQLIFVG